jgi:hypothetical protein
MLLDFVKMRNPTFENIARWFLRVMWGRDTHKERERERGRERERVCVCARARV